MAIGDIKKKKESIFKVGKFYVADEENYCMEFNTFNEAKNYAMDGEVVLICVSPSSKTGTQNTVTSNVVPYKPVKADKIIINFDKKILTVEGFDVTICKTPYKVGENTLPDVYDWEELLQSATLNSSSVEIIGRPPLKENEEDITNEMSDL